MTAIRPSRTRPRPYAMMSTGGVDDGPQPRQENAGQSSHCLRPARHTSNARVVARQPIHQSLALPNDSTLRVRRCQVPVTWCPCDGAGQNLGADCCALRLGRCPNAQPDDLVQRRGSALARSAGTRVLRDAGSRTATGNCLASGHQTRIGRLALLYSAAVVYLGDLGGPAAGSPAWERRAGRRTAISAPGTKPLLAVGSEVPRTTASFGRAGGVSVDECGNRSAGGHHGRLR